MILPNFYVVLYILTFIIGTMFATIIGILYLRERSTIYGMLLGFATAFLLYSIFEFLLCMVVYVSEGEHLIKFLIVSENICYDTFLLCWTILIGELIGGKEPVKRKALIIITVIYALVCEPLGVIHTNYDQGMDIFSVQEGLGQVILLIINFCYSLMIIYITATYLVRAIQAIKRKEKSLICGILPASLILYIIWIMNWDYGLIGSDITNGAELTLTDPMVTIYIFLCIITTCIIYRNDKLDYLKKEPIAQSEEELRERLNEYYITMGLTAREIQVTELVCQGMGNSTIAETLFITENTVKRHLNNIFRKTGCKSRFELMAAIKEQGG